MGRLCCRGNWGRFHNRSLPILPSPLYPFRPTTLGSFCSARDGVRLKINSRNVRWVTMKHFTVPPRNFLMVMIGGIVMVLCTFGFVLTLSGLF